MPEWESDEMPKVTKCNVVLVLYSLLVPLAAAGDVTVIEDAAPKFDEQQHADAS